jgi:hypothetical protein
VRGALINVLTAGLRHDDLRFVARRRFTLMLARVEGGPEQEGP